MAADVAMEESATLSDLDGALGLISSRRMLDVATGRGRMVRFIIDRLASYDEVVAIDRDAALATDFHSEFGDLPKIRFEICDALAMPFAAGSFDTVTMSHALCEFGDGDRATLLRTLRRLVAPDGVVVISDTFRDQASEPELTHVLLHDWWSEVDARDGILHRPFRTRATLAAQVEALPFSRLRMFDVSEAPGDPHDPAVLEWIDGVIDTSLARVVSERGLEARGLELRARMHDVGFRIATAQVALGHVS